MSESFVHKMPKSTVARFNVLKRKARLKEPMTKEEKDQLSHYTAWDQLRRKRTRALKETILAKELDEEVEVSKVELHK